MATTKALELAQLSTNLQVDGNGNVTNINIDSSQVSDANSALFYTDARVQAVLDGSPTLANDLTVTDSLSSNTITISDSTNASNTTTGALTVAGGIGVQGAVRASNLGMTNVVTNNLLKFNGTIIDDAIISDDGTTATVSGNLEVSGDFTVSGNTTYVNSNDLSVEDLNITLAAGANTSAVADGAGFTIDGANASLTWVHADSRFTFSTGLGVTGNANISGNLDLSAASTETRALQIGHARQGDGISLIDLVGDTTYSDYGLRVQRASTANGKSSLIHRGTGNLEIRALEEATIRFKTADADRMQIKGGGDITMFDSNATQVTVWDASESSLNAPIVNATTLNATTINGTFGNTVLTYTSTAPSNPVQGNFYFDQLNQKLKIYTGSNWVDAVPSSTGSSGNTASTDANSTFTKYQYDITSATSTISGADSSNNTLSYDTSGIENVEVFVNGIKLVEGTDYSATTGTSIGLSENAGAGSTVEVQVYELLTNDAYYLKTETYTQTEVNSQITTAVGDYVPKAGGTFTGALNFNNSIDVNGGVDFNADYNILEFYKADKTTRLGYFLLRDDNANYLEFNDTDSGQDFAFVSNNNRVLTLQAGGNIGIGESNPSQKLEVAGNISIGSGSQWIGRDNQNNSFGFNASFGQYINSTASIELAIDSNGTDTDTRFFRVVKNDYAYASPTELFKIKENGNVGISTDPSERLHVAGNIRVNNNQEFRSVDTGGSTRTIMRINNSNQLEYGWSGSGPVKIMGGGSYTERMRVHTNGFIGINEDSPEHELDVNGAIGIRQVRHSIAPTINLDFSNRKELDSRISFSRNSIASYYDANGVLRFADEGEPRFDHDPATGESKGLLIEQTTQNILTNSNQPRAWTIQTYAHVHERVAKSPDGRFNAFKVAGDLVSGRKGIATTMTTYANNTYAVSCYAKAAEYDYFTISTIYGNNSAGNAQIFDLANGTHKAFSSGSLTSSGNMTYVGDGWYRCEYIFTNNLAGVEQNYVIVAPSNSYSPTTQPNFRTADFVGNGIDGVYIYGVQVEEIHADGGPTSYIPSVTEFSARTSRATYQDENGIVRTAPRNKPRYGYAWDGVRWVETDLILEKESTNIARNVNYWYFESGSGQVRDQFTDETLAPDNTYTATKFDFTNASDDAWTDAVWFPSVNWAGTTKTFSIWLKGTAGETVNLKLDGQGGGGGYKQITLTGDWQRESVSHAYGSAYGVNASVRFGKRNLGNPLATANVIYAWGAQVEDGFTATSYIYTTSSSTAPTSVTRAADQHAQATMTRRQDLAMLTNLSRHFDSRNEMSAFVHASADNQMPNNGRFYELTDEIDSDDNRIISYYNTQYRLLYRTDYTNWTVASSTGDYTDTTEIKQAMNWTPDNIYVADSTGYLSGGDTTNGTYRIWDNLYLGSGNGDANFGNVHIKKLALYEKALSTSELVALTEND